MSITVPDILPALVRVCARPYDERPLGARASDVAIPPEIAASAARRRAEFVAGRMCARDVLAALGVADREVGIGALGAPAWPAGVVGSITHSHGLAIAAAARASDLHALGIDVENIVTRQQAEELAPSIASRGELQLLGLDNAAVAFTTLFAAKEAVFKCLAPTVGRYFDFLDVRAVSRDDTALDLEVCRDLAPAFTTGTRLRVRLAYFDARVLAATFVTRLSFDSGASTAAPA